MKTRRFLWIRRWQARLILKILPRTTVSSVFYSAAIFLFGEPLYERPKIEKIFSERTRKSPGGKTSWNSWENSLYFLRQPAKSGWLNTVDVHAGCNQARTGRPGGQSHFESCLCSGGGGSTPQK